VHELALQVMVEKTPLVPHTDEPEPEYPSLQATDTEAPVMPVMEPVVALFEFAT